VARRGHRVELDQLAAMVDADDPGVAADLQALADITRRHRVQRPLELDVVIGMHGGPGPRGAIERLWRQGQQRRLLVRLEDDARDLPRRAVQTGAGELAAPHDRPRLHVGQIAKHLAAEEVLAAV
jgi:hypothetical protein